MAGAVVGSVTNHQERAGRPRSQGGDHELSRDAGYGFDDGWPAR